MIIGDINKLYVLRQSDIGYVVGDNISKDSEVLLHNNDIDREIKLEELIEVFLFKDHKGRVAATTMKPSCTVNKFGLCTVASIQDYGIFVNIGINKDILVSDSILPSNEEYWPKVGSKVYMKLDTTQEKIFGILARKEDFDIEECIKDNINTQLPGIVFNVHGSGANVLLDNKYLGFLYKAHIFNNISIGYESKFKILDIIKDEYDLRLREQKELQIKDDTQLILDYLDTNKVLPLSDKSSPEDISKVLGISKAAFKRAVGKLLKDNLIIQNKVSNTITNKY